tara:strand:+ start:2131 stop:3363 length:1233 start_codon:yes stop_codon:yes gene_type:complete
MMSKQGCHEGNPLVFETGGIKVYAGGTNRKGGWHKMTPMPDLAMGPIGVIHSARTIDVLPEGWKSSSTLVGGKTPIVMEIDWPDYSIPNSLGPSWWNALVEDIKINNIKTISTQCMGGHGRTGVQLAILAHLLIPKAEQTWSDAHGLITWVRGNFCDHAVEAKSQQTYVADVCGIPVGKSAIVVTETQWSNFDYSADNLLTDDELKREEALMFKEEKKAKAKKAAAKKAAAKKTKGGKAKAKTHTLDDYNELINSHIGFGKPSPKISTPIEDGWTILECCDCYHHQWRRANRNTFTTPCDKCTSDAGFVQIDHEFLDGNKTKYCKVTDNLYHQIEMYDSDVSYLGEAISRGIQIRNDKDGFTTIKIGNRYIPTHLLKTEGDEILSIRSVTNKPMPTNFRNNKDIKINTER